MGSDDDIGNNGAFLINRDNGPSLSVIASDQCGWDHVSVSLPARCPTWEEMCFVKDLFFDPQEAVMQLHPPRSDYVNCHPCCLHMWRPHNRSIPLPPSLMVGPK